MTSSKKSAGSGPPCVDAACVATQFYCAEGYEPEASVAYLMRRILIEVSHEIERQLEPSALTNAQWVPLFKLYLGVASTVAELARECHLDAGAMTRLLDRLEAKGLCRRVRSKEDRRVVHIELTDAGREAAAGIPVVLSRVQNANLAGFSVEEFDVLKGLLRRFLNNAQAQSQTPLIPGGPNEA
jgi:DNA-binding MarR family transcriptional regulator